MAKRIGIQKRWMDAILSGEKTVEGKKGSPRWTDLKKGDKITFFVDDTPNCNLECTCDIIGIRHYPSLTSYLETEGLRSTLPGIQTLDEGVELYREYWTPHEILLYGVLAIAVKVVGRVPIHCRGELDIEWALESGCMINDFLL
jgi:ASC-1-like (ASCH) protein